MHGRGVIWKMKEDLRGPYPGYGLGALDAFDGYTSNRMLSEIRRLEPRKKVEAGSLLIEAERDVAILALLRTAELI